MRKKIDIMFEEGTIKRLKIQAILEETSASKILEKLALEYLEKNEGRFTTSNNKVKEANKR